VGEELGHERLERHDAGDDDGRVHFEGGPVGQVDAAVGEVGVGRVFGLDEDAEADEGDEAYAVEGGEGG
jgi:hypothetical protein